MDRKDFLKQGLALCGLGLIPIGIIESCNKTNTIAPTNVNFTLDLTNAANSSLQTVGGSLIANSVLVIRTSNTVFSAFSSICTHNGCSVGYSSASAAIICPCHGGVFNATTGSPVSGPPQVALQKYTVTQTGNIITVKS